LIGSKLERYGFFARFVVLIEFNSVPRVPGLGNRRTVRWIIKSLKGLPKRTHQNLFDLVGLRDEDKLAFAVALLRKMLYLGGESSHQIVSIFQKDFNEFKARITLQFKVDDEVRVARYLLAAAIQKNSVQSYTPRSVYEGLKTDDKKRSDPS
jgi:hypothetical protein